MQISWKPLIVALVAWHLISLCAMVAFRSTMAPLLIMLYTAWFGDIQHSFGRFERIGVYAGLTAVTTTATACVFPIFDWGRRRKTALRTKVICFAAGEVALLLTLIWSYESGFPYELNQLGWRIFGPPTDVYSFRNVVLHRLIAWQISTTPIVLIALWLYGKLDSRAAANRRAANDQSGR